jgi:hypothetical protein
MLDLDVAQGWAISIFDSKHYRRYRESGPYRYPIVVPLPLKEAVFLTFKRCILVLLGTTVQKLCEKRARYRNAPFTLDSKPIGFPRLLRNSFTHPAQHIFNPYYRLQINPNRIAMPARDASAYASCRATSCS